MLKGPKGLKSPMEILEQKSTKLPLVLTRFGLVGESSNTGGAASTDASQPKPRHQQSDHIIIPTLSHVSRNSRVQIIEKAKWFSLQCLDFGCAFNLKPGFKAITNLDKF